MGKKRVRVKYRVDEQGRATDVEAQFGASPTSRRRKRMAAIIALFLCAGTALGYYAITRPERPPGPAPDGMVWIPGGKFQMGTDDTAFLDANHLHQVTVSSFWMDATEVTNAEFERFVKATGYVTVMERNAENPEISEVVAKFIRVGPLVFATPKKLFGVENQILYWRNVPGANWRHPHGPESSISDRMNHPVVQVCWEDATAYAQWAGKRLPTEAEWEYAARGGLSKKQFTWGDEFQPGGKWQANLWQGNYPTADSGDDGFTGDAPVGSFPANGYGLHDMSGNVWEWCLDWYRNDYYQDSPAKNPMGPPDSNDPVEPGVPKRVRRGGSYLCAESYCRRYVPGARHLMDPLTAACNVGFRCVKEP